MLELIKVVFLFIWLSYSYFLAVWVDYSYFLIVFFRLSYARINYSCFLVAFSTELCLS